MLAARVSRTTAAITIAYVNGSVVRVSKSRPRMSGPAAMEASPPIAAPIAVSHTARPTTTPHTDARVAPSARRMPISGMRCVTEYQIDP